MHILGYFLDARSPALLAFLAGQRQQRIDRIRLMIGKLAVFGIRLDADAIVQPAIDDPSRSVGRPWIARALVAGGYVKSTNDAFGIWLSRGKPAFVARESAGPDEVIARIHDAGGIASLAHPGLVGHDEWIPPLAAAGLDALEVYHTDHDKAATRRYRALADAAWSRRVWRVRFSRRRVARIAVAGNGVAAARGLRAACCSRPPQRRVAARGDLARSSRAAPRPLAGLKACATRGRGLIANQLLCGLRDLSG